VSKSLHEYCLENHRDDILQQWHPTKNGPLTPAQIAAKSHKKVWWICADRHEWQAVISSRSNGAGCPVCTRRVLLRDKNDLATTHPHICNDWHPSKNGTLKPQDVVAGTAQKVWWICEKKHEWQATVFSRTSYGTGCPVCAGKIIIPGENDLASAFPDVAEEWHPTKNDPFSPQTVSPYSNRKAWWQCALGHEYLAGIADRTSRKHGCPYCSGKRVLQGFNDLATREPMVADQWHPTLNGPLKPDMVTSGSHKHAWWECSNGHIWKARISSRARGKKAGCPVCAGKVNPQNVYKYDTFMLDK
jgi:DNA-directed RNA polymerase subunit RPC12/RpoP